MTHLTRSATKLHEISAHRLLSANDRCSSTPPTHAQLPRLCAVFRESAGAPHTMPFCLVRPRVGETTPFSMSTERKKKTTALREASMLQPRTAQPCRCRQFDLPLPRTHAHIFARRWLGACMPPPTPPANSQQSPSGLLQQQNGPKECFPNAGYRIISTCADEAKPIASLINSLTTCVRMTPLSGARWRRKV